MSITITMTIATIPLVKYRSAAPAHRAGALPEWDRADPGDCENVVGVNTVLA